MSADGRGRKRIHFVISENIPPGGALALNEAARAAFVRIFGAEAMARVKESLAAQAADAAPAPEPKAE